MPGVVLCVPHHRKRVYFRFAWIGPGCMQDLMDLLDVTIDQRFQGKAREKRPNWVCSISCLSWSVWDAAADFGTARYNTF